jgi:hypothetical protein
MPSACQADKFSAERVKYNRLSRKKFIFQRMT